MLSVPVLLLLAGGFLGGFFGAAVGSAGLVSLPILLLLGLSPHAAIGTTRPAAAVLELVSGLRYWREGKLSGAALRRGLLLGCAGAVGSTIGAALIVRVSAQHLRLVLAIVIAGMTAVLFTRKQWGMAERPERQKRVLAMATATMATGLYAGLFGFTFGTLITLVLVGFGYTLLQGAAMGRVIGTVTSTVSAAVFFLHGYVDVHYAIALSIGFALGGWMGAKTAVRGGNRYVKILLLLVVLASVAKLLWDFIAAP